MVHEVTGYTLHYLVHGYNPKPIFDIALIPPTETNLINKINKLKYFCKKLPPKIIKRHYGKGKTETLKHTIFYKGGHKILVKINTRHNKFSNLFERPYEIVK